MKWAVSGCEEFVYIEAGVCFLAYNFKIKKRK